MKRLAAALTLLVGVAAALFVHHQHRSTTRAAARPARPWLLVYNAVSHDVTMLADPERPSGARVTLDCLALPPWALRVGVHGDALVLLDPAKPAPAILTLSMAALARAAEREAPCAEARPRRTPLHSTELPYHGLLAGDRLYIDYFSGNLVEAYSPTGGDGAGPPSWRLDFSMPFTHPESLGLSDMAVVGNALVVAATGYFCYAPHCPDGHFRAPRLFFADAAGAAHAPFPEARPANINSSGLYRDPSGALFVINTGDYSGGYGSLQKVRDDRSFGPEIRLPRTSAPGSAWPLAGGLFAVLQFSGEHVFLVDAAGERLRKILRFDGNDFVELPLDTAALPDRSSSDFQDVVADPASPTRFFFVDAKRQQLLHVELDVAQAALRVLGATPLGTSAFRASPSWAVWLR